MALRQFPPHQGVKLTARVTEDGDAVDAATVTCDITDPNAATTQYTLAGGTITHVSVGLYRVDVTPTVAGTWTYRFRTTSPNTSTADLTFVVPASVFS